MIEVQDVFREHAYDYLNYHKAPYHVIKAINDIISCRTSSLGGHVDECDDCGHVRISYNSCRNRHCPKCQSLVKEKWIHDRYADLLPVHYFHIVFTIPDKLNNIVLLNQEVMYSILFKAVSDTLLSKAKEYLNANIGFTSILHTWGQNLMFHPHIHCIVPGGGLSFDNSRWISSKKNFFIHVNILSSKFKRRFVEYLKDAYYNNKLILKGSISNLNHKYVFQDFISKILKLKWVVFSKSTFKKSHHVIKYLSNYTHRVAISNNRLINLKDGRVTFKYKDYKDNNKIKLMTIDATEFIRRFLLHILPLKFVKIRHYGILCNRNKQSNLKIIREYLSILLNRPIFNFTVLKFSTKDLIFNVIGLDTSICPYCNKGTMIPKDTNIFNNNSPPKEYKHK